MPSLRLFLALFGNEPPFPHAVLARDLAFLDERPRKPSSAQDGDLDGGGGLPCIFAPSEAGLPLLLLGLLDRWASMASSSKGRQDWINRSVHSRPPHL